MARLTPVSQRHFVERLRALGFEWPYAGGRHPQMRRGEITLLTPSPYAGDIGVGLLSQAGVSREAGADGVGYWPAETCRVPAGRWVCRHQCGQRNDAHDVQLKQ